VPAETLTLRRLNRATLARQMLLEREKATPVKAINRLGGLQAQEAKHPFAGLWTRVEGFRRESLVKALNDRKVVRASWLRATLHLVSADDYAAGRAALQPVMTGAATAALRGRDDGLDVPEVVATARKLLAKEPRNFTELRDLLLERFPKVNERALGYATRMHLPLVMVPTDTAWAFPAQADFTLADAWLKKKLSTDEDPTPHVRRHLAAFGPATAADVQTWSGLKGVKAVLKDEAGRALFDLPDAPRPDEDVPAPVRFLPEFDNLVLAHQDRTRVLADEHRGQVTTKNLRVRATFLVDGVVAGTWTTERKRDAATLTLAPFGKLAKAAQKELTAEGEALLAFLEPDAATFDVTRA
jgi:hypothetical protein